MNLSRISKTTSVLFFLYLFFVSISLMSHAFEGFGSGFAERLITTTSNPFVGLFIGILATSIIQSSGTTTSMVVAFVASGVLSVRSAIPIVMGANIGTTVTCTLVALGHITRKEEFKRAFGGSIMHDFFNILTVVILFPIEMSTHYLEKAGIFLTSVFNDIGGKAITSPIKIIVKPAISAIDSLLRNNLNVSNFLLNIIFLIIALMLLFLSLYNISQVMKSLVMKKADMVFDKVIRKNAILAMVMGMLFTAIVRSSSITTSLLVPLIAAGILSLEHSFPIVLGANVGTTITAILAALTGNVAGITIAFVHLVFNITGILILYPFKILRWIPVKLARFVAEMCTRQKIFALFYVIGLFYLVPISLILLSRFFGK
ncbi:MAG: Na/Pi symporter [Candidatus Omnitrophica bacterium]|nr:Na/Pi symporter [Candidatus Omnitrophota bacterium]